MKIGIIKEGKMPPDKRAPFSPDQCKQLTAKFPGLEILVQPSPFRCFSDDEYREAGIPLTNDLSHCDVLMGVKEVPVRELLPGKTYFFFSHITKKQKYNQELLQEVVRKNIRLIDYEKLVDSNGMRLIGFGRIAGLVGTYNGLLTYGKRNGLFNLKPAHLCKDLAEMKEQAGSIRTGPVKIAVTGGGRAAGGAMELLDHMHIRKLTVAGFLRPLDPAEAVYVQLNPEDYNMHLSGKNFETDHFFIHPEEYQGNFRRFCSRTDLLVAAAYWDPKAPVLFTEADMKRDDFRIRVIADITCDIDGSVPSTKRAGTIEDPVYDFNPATATIEPACSSPGHVSVMAVDNLPGELPGDASIAFGKDLTERVIPHLINDTEEIIANATIAKDGKLTDRFSYLNDFLLGKE